MSQLINLLIKRFSLIGKVPLCNGIPSRAPHFFGFCFPLCYRCLSFVVMFVLVLYWGHKKHQQYPWYVIIILLIPMIVDGCLQTFFGIESTNIRRIITGGMFGIGLGLFTTKLFIIVDRNIKERRIS